jgi:hypothetical protein
MKASGHTGIDASVVKVLAVYLATTSAAGAAGIVANRTTLPALKFKRIDDGLIFTEAARSDLIEAILSGV